MLRQYIVLLKDTVMRMFRAAHATLPILMAVAAPVGSRPVLVLLCHHLTYVERHVRFMNNANARLIPNAVMAQMTTEMG